MMNPYESPNIGYLTQIIGLGKNYKLKDTKLLLPSKKESKESIENRIPLTLIKEPE